MLKKPVLLAALLLVSVLLMSCQAKEPAPSASPVPDVTATPVATPSTTPSPTPIETPETVSYEITETVYAEGDINITYPQITGLSDASLQEQINTLIQADATAIAEEGGSVDVAYTVTWSGSKMLSICYDGLRTIEGAAYPNNLFYTTNIDITNGTKVRLADMVAIDDDFIAVFKTGEFVPWNADYAEAEDMIRESVTGYDLAQIFANADKGYGQENPDYCFSYFTEDALGVSIGIPHAVGDHAEFEIKYADIPDSSKTNAVWDDFAVSSVPAAVTGDTIDLDTAFYGDWVITRHIVGNRVSTYSQEAIDAMIGQEMECSSTVFAFDGDVLENPHYMTMEEQKSEHDAINDVSFADLGITADSVVRVDVYTDEAMQQFYLSQIMGMYLVDTDTLIVIGEGEFFEAKRP